MEGSVSRLRPPASDHYAIYKNMFDRIEIVLTQPFLEPGVPLRRRKLQYALQAPPSAPQETSFLPLAIHQCVHRQYRGAL